MENNIAIIIPARYGSSRLEGKPLIKVNGKSIIQWVWEKAKQAKLANNIIIATDHELIFNECKAFGANVEMTSINHKCGSDRIAEVTNRHPEYTHIINLQGDEPMITPEIIDSAISTLLSDVNVDISTLIKEINDQNELNNPNLVKCVIDKAGFALYFSRSKIPYERNLDEGTFYAHIGLYGYTRNALFKMTSLKQSMLEKTESLEQLRAIENSMKIKTCIVKLNAVGIDTKEDVEKFKELVKG